MAAREAHAPQLLAAFGVSAPKFVDRTAIATVWQVARADGTPAALKAWHGGDLRNEAPGLDLMAAWDGAGVARIYDRQDGAVLMEWLGGPSLGDMTREGDDAGAARILADVANALQDARPTVPPGLPRLSDWFRPLLALELDSACPAQARRDMEACRALARGLLATERDVRPLHGDLHHDNVRRGARGYLAFDAKGLMGERAFELANAFRNPKGAEALLREPACLLGRADVWSAALGVDRARLLQWAAAKCALSIAWRAKGRLRHDRELDLLGLLARLTEPPA